jgi:ureidoglycolate lyase
VIYAPGVWHMGATVLDRPGHFTVLMWRGGAEPDDEFREISPLSLTET